MGLNQAGKRDFGGLFKAFASQDIIVLSSAPTTDAILSSGLIIDRLADGRGYECAVGLVAANVEISTTGELLLRGYFMDDTSSAMGGAVAYGSTSTLTVDSTAAGSSHNAVLKHVVDLSDANRYIKFVWSYERTTAAGTSGTLSAVVLLAGADELPCS
jgi:hypothetical protein